MSIRNVLLTMALAAGAAFGQYKMEPAGPPPSDLASAIAGTLEKDGYRILGAGGAAVCEIWA